MPALTSNQRVQAILDALAESNASAVLLSTNRGNPFKFAVSFAQGSFVLWAYIWTLTHGGGRARPVNEYRIQITGIRSPLQLNPNGPTLLIGYEPNVGCFAGFDISKHHAFSTKSPSIQIPITVLNDALQYGYSFVTKGNNEIAIGIRSDQFLSYCLNTSILHSQGGDAITINLLQRAASLEMLGDEDYQEIAAERQTIVREVSRLSRASNFRKKVTDAYGRRCAVTRMQLNLIDAAHILPVGVSGSNDEVINGICLSPTYHRAFDTSLIYLDENLVMRINPLRRDRLIAEGLGSGLESLQGYLDNRIHLPQDNNLWPSKEMIRKANAVRKIN